MHVYEIDAETRVNPRFGYEDLVLDSSSWSVCALAHAKARGTDTCIVLTGRTYCK